MDEIHALTGYAYMGLPVSQNDNILPSFNPDIQLRSSHPHRRNRGADRVGFFVRVPGNKTKRADGELNCDIPRFGIVEDRPIQPKSRSWPE